MGICLEKRKPKTLTREIPTQPDLKITKAKTLTGEIQTNKHDKNDKNDKNDKLDKNDKIDKIDKNENNKNIKNNTYAGKPSETTITNPKKLLSDKTAIQFNPKEKVLKKVIQILVLGDKGVGKSTWIEKLISNKFIQSNIVSIGIEEYTKPQVVDEKEIFLNFQILPGDREYKKDYSYLFQQIDFFLVFYDMTSELSYKNAMELINSELNTYITKDKRNVLILGNKSDLGNKIPCVNDFETSARTKQNMQSIVNTIIDFFHN
jgi:small GTP-binding protein